MRSISMAFLGSAAYSSKGAGSNFSFIEGSPCAHNENVAVNQQVCLKSRPSHLCVGGADLRENGWIPLTFPFNDRPRKYSQVEINRAAQCADRQLISRCA